MTLNIYTQDLNQNQAVLEMRPHAEAWAHDLAVSTAQALGLGIKSFTSTTDKQLFEQMQEEGLDFFKVLSKAQDPELYLTSERRLRKSVQAHLGGTLGYNIERKECFIQHNGIFVPISDGQVRQIVDYYVDSISIYTNLMGIVLAYLSKAIKAMPKGEEGSGAATDKESAGKRLDSMRTKVYRLSKIQETKGTVENIARSLVSMKAWNEETFEKDDRNIMVIGDYTLDLRKFRKEGTTLEDCLTANNLVYRDHKVIRKASFDLKDRYRNHLPYDAEKEYKASNGLSALDTPLVENEVFERFLIEAVPDEGMRESMLQALAIGVFGAPTSFRNFLDLHGAPRSGKSSMTTILSFLFNEYVGGISGNSFSSTVSEASREYAVADAEGKRVVFLDEFNARADSASIKKFSGGTTFTTSKKYQNSRTWLPQGTLVFISNPGLDFDADADEAFIKRWLPVHFPKSYAKGQEGDPPSEELYASCKANLAGVFLSLARAFQRAKASGAQTEDGVFELNPSPSQEAYKAERLGDMDPVGSFLEWLKDDGVLLPVEEGDRTSGKGSVLPKVSVLQKGYDAYVREMDISGAPKSLKAELGKRDLTVNVSRIIRFKGYKLGGNLTQNIAHGIHA